MTLDLFFFRIYKFLLDIRVETQFNQGALLNHGTNLIIHQIEIHH